MEEDKNLKATLEKVNMEDKRYEMCRCDPSVFPVIVLKQSLMSQCFKVYFVYWDIFKINPVIRQL